MADNGRCNGVCVGKVYNLPKDDGCEREASTLQSIACYAVVLFLMAVCVDTSAGRQAPGLHDFSSARLVTADQLSGAEETAVEMLVEEIESRTNIRLSSRSSWPASSVPVIAIGSKSSIGTDFGPHDRSSLVQSLGDQPEGFTVKLLAESGQAPQLLIIGNDPRGVLFGAGYVLRKMSLYPGRLLVPGAIDITTHPAIPLRGHQLGYRPKTNSYDGFTVGMWEQYIRDLVVFGINAIELIPPNTDDADDSPMFPRPQMDMMVKMDRLLVKYDLDAWIWYPLMYGDYTKPENVEASLEENERVFSKLPKIDALFIPGGDPGHQHPDVLFDYLEKQATILHKYHPEAEIWVSPQGFDRAWMDDFFSLLEEEPAWLSGIVYGPQVREDVDQLRERIPDSYRIRRYPDITHNLDSQYPVPNWDFAFAATEHRESINPRPTQQQAIFKTFTPDAYYGFITYSEGVNDDVNKAIWSGLGWDPDAEVIEILRDYSRYFMGPDYENDFAQGLLDLEKNWDGPLLGNTSVYATHYRFQSMEERALPRVRLNWRFQMALFRSYYDAYNRSRLLHETQLEDRAMSVLRRAKELGSFTAMDEAERVLAHAQVEYPAEDWRSRLFELAEALFQSIRMQKTVDEHFAIATRRGANLDLVDYPLNNRIWLTRQFERIRELDSEEERLAEIKKVTHWKDPGPGGFYDDLGDLDDQPHLVEGKTYGDDPAFLNSPFVGFTIYDRTKHWRVSWARYVQTLYGQPLEMRYTDLDPTARYEVMVTYTGNAFEPRIRMRADEGFEVHPYMKKPRPIKPVVFDVPQKATNDGVLTLRWNIESGVGGTGRGCQVAEVWLIKKEKEQEE